MSTENETSQDGEHGNLHDCSKPDSITDYANKSQSTVDFADNQKDTEENQRSRVVYKTAKAEVKSHEMADVNTAKDTTAVISDDEDIPKAKLAPTEKDLEVESSAVHLTQAFADLTVILDTNTSRIDDPQCFSLASEFPTPYLGPPRDHVLEKAHDKETLENVQKLNIDFIELRKKGRIEEGIKMLYQIQHIHEPNCLQGEARNVPVHISSNISEPWRRSAEEAISSIRKAAPGINIRSVSKQMSPIITIEKDQTNKDPQTKGDIWEEGWARIYLPNNYAKDYLTDREYLIEELGESAEEIIMVATCTHELFHALGYGHEHQSSCNCSSLGVATSSNDQFRPLLNLVNLTRFDPYSITLYPGLPWQGKDTVMKNRKKSPHNWVMSELDKITLNMIYPPRNCSKGDSIYLPSLSHLSGTDMYYCFREVMESHNHPYKGIIKHGICGENKFKPNGPNCPACRTLKCKRSFDISRWQGWSGMIYCGQFLRNCNRTCRPDHGNACDCTCTCGSNLEMACICTCGPDHGMACEICSSIFDL